MKDIYNTPYIVVSRSPDRFDYGRERIRRNNLDRARSYIEMEQQERAAHPDRSALVGVWYEIVKDGEAVESDIDINAKWAT